MSKYVCIIAGDTSGDVYAGDLIAQLATNRSDIKFQGIAGDSAQSQGMQLWVHNKHLNFMGFTEVLLRHKLIISTWRTITQNIEKNKPDLLILIDYPGLNMRVAKWAKQRGIPIFYYIPPQVWAWGRARIEKLRQYTDYIAPLYPFEQDFLIKAKLNTTLVKHPLLNKILAQQLNHPCTEKPIEIVCMPGSREQEVRKHLENMLTAIYILQVKVQKAIKNVLHQTF